jgi:hypothetical protein
MKTKTLILLSIAGVVAGAAQAGTFVTHLSEHAGLNASPRAQEDFPALHRTAEARVRPTQPVVAWTSSPRGLEEFPLFQRISVKRDASALDQRGLAANPRALEDHPALARTPRDGAAAEKAKFQIAPLRERKP